MSSAVSLKTKLKHTICAALILFALVSIGVAVRDIARSRELETARDASFVPAVAEGDGSYVALLRGTAFCPTCDIMEEKTGALMSGAGAPSDFRFVVVNYEVPENEHYLFDFDLYTTSIVLIEQRGGRCVRWRTLDRSWEMAELPSGFEEYISEEISSFREEGHGA